MGSELENNESQNTSLKDYFEELFVYALSIGMTYEQFWYDDPFLFNSYYNAEKLRMKKKNQEMWLQGLYIYQAVGNLAPILNGNVKHPKAQPYLKEPLPINEEEAIEKENKKIARFKAYLEKRAREGK